MFLVFKCMCKIEEMLFIQNDSCVHICVFLLYSTSLLWSCCVVALLFLSCWCATIIYKTSIFLSWHTRSNWTSGKWLNENTKDWFSCGYEYYFVDWEVLWLNSSSFHTHNYSMILKILSLSGQAWFDYRIKDTRGNSGRLYFHDCGPLEQHGKQCHRDCFLLNLVQMPGSNPAWARLSVAERQGKKEYKNYPMASILSCAGRLLLNNAKCPTLPRQISLLLLSTKNFLERFSK